MKLASKIMSLILALTTLAVMYGCSGSGSGNSGSGKSGTHTVTDHLGYDIEVPYDVNRIVVCDILPLPSVLTVFFGSAEKIVGMAPGSMSAAENGLLGQLYPELLDAGTAFLDGKDVNTEELLKLSPDVVFYSASTPAVGEKLRSAGFAAIAVSVNKWEYNCIETLNNWIALFSEIFPESDVAKKVEDYSNEKLALVTSRVSEIPESERERIFFLFNYSDSTIATSGSKFFGQWWADAIGALNVGAEITTDNSVTVNMEQIYAWNPSVILITNFTTAVPDDLYNNSVGSWDWSGIDAVESKKVYKMPLGLYRSYTPGADTPITLLWMAKTVYPDYFEDIDITAETKNYYSQVFGITLTDEQAELIFSPEKNAGTGMAYQQ